MLKVIFVCIVWIGLTYGYSRFRGEIPNGYNVKHPCRGGGTWDAVGHMSPQYTTRKNAFGQVSIFFLVIARDCCIYILKLLIEFVLFTLVWA